MKQSLFILLCTCLLVACSDNNFGSPEIVYKSHSSEEFNVVLNDIASLNNKFNCDVVSTRSGLRFFFYQVADFAGGYYGSKLGMRLGFSAGSATGSPAFGGFAAGAGYMLGGIAGSVAASELFDLVCPSDDYCERVDNPPFDHEDLVCFPYEGSSGSVHNTILYALENNGKDYIDGTGSILVEELFRDALEYEEGLHLDNVVTNVEYINEMGLFCKDLYAAIKNARSQELMSSQVCDVIFSLLREKGCSENDVMELKALGDALLPCISLDEEDVPAYELEFNSIIESSELDESDKVCLKTAGSVYIHSVQYWY